MEVAYTRTSTSSSPGCGFGTSATSSTSRGRPQRLRTIALIVSVASIAVAIVATRLLYAVSLWRKLDVQRKLVKAHGDEVPKPEAAHDRARAGAGDRARGQGRHRGAEHAAARPGPRGRGDVALQPCRQQGGARRSDGRSRDRAV